MAARLDSRLSKALIEAGALDPSALEDAVQQQMIHGGSLDTILLEKDAVDERTLAALLSKAWATDAVTLEAIERPDPSAVKALPERMALTMRLCPFAVEGTAVHVMCAAPLDRGLVEEVSALLAKPFVPHVVPEVRLWQALQQAYAVVPDERFAALLNDLRAPSRALDRSDEGAPVDDLDDVPEPSAGRWDLVEALAHLAAQETRDGIVKVAVSFARKHTPFAAMFGIRHADDGVDGGGDSERGATCVGWLRSGPAEGIQFQNKSFAVPRDSALEAALKSPSPSLGKPALTPGNAALFGWLGRRRPKTFLVIPVFVIGKPVGALVADGGIRARDFSSLSELVGFSARLGPAFEALLRNRRAQNESSLPRARPSSSPQRGHGFVEGDARRETTKPMFDIHTEVTAPGPFLSPSPSSSGIGGVDTTAPMPHLKGLGSGVDLEEVPAPPPLPEPREGEPRPITMTAMPAVSLDLPRSSSLPAASPSLSSSSLPASSSSSTSSLPELVPTSLPELTPVRGVVEKRDGTSPFARNYVAAKVEPPAPPPPPPPPPLVFEQLSGLSNANIIVPPPAFADIVETKAADAWRGALEDAVERGHQGGTVSAEDKPRLFLDEEGWEDVQYDTYEIAEAKSGAGSMAALSMGLAAEDVDMSSDSAAPKTEVDGAPIGNGAEPEIAELVDQLDALDDGTVSSAKKRLLSRGKDAIPALEARFPGRLRVDPFDPGESVRSADKLGALVDTLFALGPAGLDAAIPHLDSRYPAHRYAAVLLFTLTPDERGIDLLRPRLHDQEPRIRALAAEALAPFVAHPRFEAVLVHLRERMMSPLLDARRRAVQLLGAFRDVGAVPALVALLETKGAAELAEDSRQALRAITLQDFGVRAKGWDKWWTKAKKKSRVDWLIDGLSSDDRELRTIAHVELAAITGDDFGYRPDEPKRNRERAVAVFQTWWAEEQKRPKAS